MSLDSLLEALTTKTSSVTTLIRTINKHVNNIEYLTISHQKPCEADSLAISINAIEEANCELGELVDDLRALQRQIEDELENPTCDICGEKEMVRSKVDEYSEHKCTGE